MTRNDLRALMAAIISVDPTAPGGIEYPLRQADAILAETHPAPEVTIAPGPHSFYDDGSPVPTGHGTTVYVGSSASISNSTTPPEGAPREPDGWMTPRDVQRIRDRNVGDRDVPSVNVWASQDPGDSPVYIGSPPPERAESEEWRNLVMEERGEYTVYCDYAGTRHRINAADFVQNIAARARAEVLEEVRAFADSESLIVHDVEGRMIVVSFDDLNDTLDRLSSEGADE